MLATATGLASAQDAPESQSVAMPPVPDALTQADFINAAEQTVNGVVSVKSFATPSPQRRSQIPADPFLEYFFGIPSRPQQQHQQEAPQRRQTGLGSGVIISQDGYIVTNNHVIDGAESLEVTLNDNRNYTATVIGSDPMTDLALIKIEAPGLHVIPVGRSEDLHVGEWVLAVGNPFGFTSTVTSGIVSAKGRNISSMSNGSGSQSIESYIQTDAALNSGNSGGALVNLRGELVGINAAIYSQTGTYAGCSFAIPTSIMSKVVNDIKEYGTVQRAVLGIAFGELTPEMIAELQIEGTSTGVYIGRVEPESAAEEAGLAQGDVIVAIGDYPIASTAQMQEVMSYFSPGDNIVIHFFREGSRKQTSATLRNKRGDTERMTAPNPENLLGATFKAIDSTDARRLDINYGVKVESVQPDGLFAQAGIGENFIILAINNTRISDPRQPQLMAAELLRNGNPRERVLFISGLYPNGRAAYYAVALDDAN